MSTTKTFDQLCMDYKVAQAQGNYELADKLLEAIADYADEYDSKAIHQTLKHFGITY